MSRALALAAAIAGVVLAGLWLWLGPPLADGLAGGVPGAAGEALFTTAIFVPLLLIAVVGGVVTGIAAWQPGMRAGRATGRGLALGLGGLLVATGYAAIAGTLGQGAKGGVGGALLVGIAVIGVQVFAEEALFRGWLQPLVARVIGGQAAVVVVALAFAAFHVFGGAHGAITLVNLSLGGLLFGILAMRDGGIAGATTAHFAWNAGEQLLLGLDPNPGVGGFGALIDLDLTGAAAWGGSDMGLNASWAMTFALASIVIALVLAASRRAAAPSATAAIAR